MGSNPTSSDLFPYFSIMLYTSRPPDIDFSRQGAICLLECHRRWLLLQNISGDDHGDLWGAPGGKLERDEQPLAGVIRELFEETGIVLAASAMSYLLQVYLVPPEGKPYSLHIFRTKLSELPNKIILDTREHQSYAWVTPEEARTYPLVPGSKQLMHILMSDYGDTHLSHD